MNGRKDHVSGSKFPLVGSLSGLAVAFMLVWSGSASATEYRDNPSFRVDQRAYPQFNVVGELYSLDQSGSVGVVTIGSAVLVAPCSVLTSFHVALRTDPVPIAGKTYSMTFSGGQGQDQGVFAGHTTATAVLFKETDHELHDGLVLMKLDRCVGTLPQFGWAEFGEAKQGADAVAVGYSAMDQRGMLHMGRGKIETVHGPSNMLELSTSFATHASGGGVFQMQDGKMRLCGIIFGDESETFADRQAVARWPKGASGLAIPIAEFLNWPEGMAWIEADKKAWGQRNPAAERMKQPFPEKLGE